MRTINAGDYTKEALIKRYPEWQKFIEAGDFRVSLIDGNKVVAEWTNTSILTPSLANIMYVYYTEFKYEYPDDMFLVAGITSLTLKLRDEKCRECEMLSPEFWAKSLMEARGLFTRG